MGSTTMLTAADGSVSGTRYYDAFGSPVSAQVGSGSYWYDGEQYDEQRPDLPPCPLLRRRPRPLPLADTATPDYADTQSLNQYVFAQNNPLRFEDPSGKFLQVLLGAAIGAAVGATADVGMTLLTDYVSNGGHFSDDLGAKVAGAAVSGAIEGGIDVGLATATGGASLVAGSLGSGVADAAGYATTAALDEYFYHKPTTTSDLVTGIAVHGVLGMAEGGLSQGIADRLVPNTSSVLNSLVSGTVSGLFEGVEGYFENPTALAPGELASPAGGQWRGFGAGGGGAAWGSGGVSGGGGAYVPATFSPTPPTMPEPSGPVVLVCDGANSRPAASTLPPGRTRTCPCSGWTSGSRPSGPPATRSRSSISSISGATPPTTAATWPSWQLAWTTRPAQSEFCRSPPAPGRR